MSSIDQSVEFQTEPFIKESKNVFKTCRENPKELKKYLFESLNHWRKSIRNSLYALRCNKPNFKEIYLIKAEDITIYPAEEWSPKDDDLYFPMKIVKFSNESYFLKPIRSENKKFGIPLEVFYRSRLRHNSIAKCVGYFKWESSKFIILQYFPKTLDQYLSENLSICEKIELIISITKGLLFLHMKNCVNMNITPWSIFIDNDNNPCFFDLECLMNVNMEPQSDLIYKEPDFSSPEALDGKRSFACDIYSLGVLSYYILTGGPYCDLIGTENLPEEFEDLIRIMISSNPNKRPDATYIIEVLQRILLDKKNL